MSTPSFPENLMCPITHEEFQDPVFAKDGFTYEKKAAEEWNDISGTSPMTKDPIDSIFIPNKTVLDIIQEAYKPSSKILKDIKMSYIQPYICEEDGYTYEKAEITNELNDLFTHQAEVGYPHFVLKTINHPGPFKQITLYPNRVLYPYNSSIPREPMTFKPEITPQDINALYTCPPPAPIDSPKICSLLKELSSLNTTCSIQGLTLIEDMRTEAKKHGIEWNKQTGGTIGPNLSRLNLNGLVLKGLYILHWTIEFADFSNVTFEDCEIYHVRFFRCNFHKTKFINTRLGSEGMYYTGSHFKNVSFDKKCYLSSADIPNLSSYAKNSKDRLMHIKEIIKAGGGLETDAIQLVD